MFKKILALMLAVSMLLCGMVSAQAAVSDGMYEGMAKGMFDGLTVNVTFAGGKIADVQVVSHSETAGISDPAIARIPAAIVENNSILVDTVAGATMTSNGILSAVKAAIAAAGGAEADFENEIAAVAVERTEKEMEADVVIAGAGIAGLAAAVKAAEEGADVILLEKMPQAGGSLSLAGGNFVTVNSAVAKEYGANDNKEDTMAFWKWSADHSMDLTNGYPDYARVEMLLDNVDGLLTWMKEHGVPFYKATDVNPASTVAKVYTEGGGSAVTASLVTAAEKAGVTILYETPAIEIIMEDGKAVGLKAQSATENLTIRAKKGVLLATGGFGASVELIEKWVPGYATAISQVAASHTGDGHLMAEAVGAKLYDNPWVMPSGVSIDPDIKSNLSNASAFSWTVAANRILVNEAGKRFTNEDVGGAYALLTNEVADEKCKTYYIFDGSDEALIPMLEEGVEKNLIVKADTIETLAAALNMADLAATVEAYNAACEQGVDAEFGKAAANLKAYTAEGPYYALKVVPALLGSMGGVVTDYNGRVQDVNGNVIEGLYAAGEMSNRTFYNQVYVGSASLSLYPISAQMAIADMLAK